MEPLSLIPAPDAIPAPWWLFEVLNGATFMLHLILANVLFGGTLLALFRAFSVKPTKEAVIAPVHSKLPTTVALTINLGVAPLLFIQVIYGHLFYSSSILMASGWILIIPLLIIGYYATYIHQKQLEKRRTFAVFSLIIAGIIFLYISYMFVNNITMMLHPEKWTTYFEQRNGWILNSGDATFLPRWLHFVAASIAVAGLFAALLWNMRRRRGIQEAEIKVFRGLKIFAFATIAQILIGFWWLIALPRGIMLEFMGQDMVRTAILGIGILLAISALVSALLNKLTATVIHILVLTAVMIVQRALLRASYLATVFNPNTLPEKPQTDVLLLFLAILVLGLVAVAWMVTKARRAETGREKS